MPAIFEAELKKKISSGDFANLFFLYGEEKYLIKHYTNLLTKKIVSPDFADFNFHTFDGKTLDFDAVSLACEALPMFSSYSCILIKDLPLDSLNAEDTDKFIELISDIAETTVIIISTLNIDVNVKSAKGKKLLPLIDKYGISVNFSHPDNRQLLRLIVKGASERGCEFPEREASYLLSLVGSDMTNLLNELEKICAFKHGGRIERSDIDAVVVKNVQARAFDLAKAITAGNCDLAMTILDTLFYMREEPVSILGAMATPYIDMYRAKVYASSGLRAEDAAKDFTSYRNKEFRLTNGARSASKYSITQLRQFLEVLSTADSKLKSTPFPPRVVLEETIARLMLISNGEKI